jgi:hypothetical protein
MNGGVQRLAVGAERSRRAEKVLLARRRGWATDTAHLSTTLRFGRKTGREFGRFFQAGNSVFFSSPEANGMLHEIATRNKKPLPGNGGPGRGLSIQSGSLLDLRSDDRISQRPLICRL